MVESGNLLHRNQFGQVKKDLLLCYSNFSLFCTDKLCQCTLYLTVKQKMMGSFDFAV